MRLSRLVPLMLAAGMLAGCLPAPDQPAWEGRIGRFAGLIAHCGCSDISEDRMLADYPKAMTGRYSPAQIAAMHGYVELAAGEMWDNQAEICAEVCAQRCMVQAVVEPLGGRSTGVAACPITERDLHLTEGRHDTGGFN